LVLLTASVIFYIGLLLLGTMRSYAHLHLALLAAQYGIIFPTLLWFLRSQCASSGESPLPRIHLGIALLTFAVVAIPLSRFSGQGLLNPDESGYSFQARVYRSGRLMADPLIGASPDVRRTSPELFYENHVLSPRGWFAKFPPGWPLMLSLGYGVSAPWLLNPVFGLLQLFAITVIGIRVFSYETGALAVFFGVLSPFFLVNSIGMMSHAFCALLSAMACLALFRALATGTLWYYAGTFACLAAMLEVRPYTGFVLALVLTSAALWLNRWNRTILLRMFSIGILSGLIALASVLLYNHAYTGNLFVSPYAMAAGANMPPELSFRPGRIWQGIRQYAPQTAEESLIGAFPFLYLLAAYAVIREKKRRREVWILAAVYLALVLAYLAHPEGSGVLFGERFHFEGFFALLLIAGRGSQLLFERWRSPRRAMIWTLILLAALQITQQSAAIAVVVQRIEPYRKVRDAIMASNLTGLVFLHEGPSFVAKHFNLNDPDWRHASRIYLIDAEPQLRDEWARRYGFTSWTVVTYDPKLKRAALLKSTSSCATLNRDFQ
jgi:hypothetical protein